jgi:hypothetical protein
MNGNKLRLATLFTAVVALAAIVAILSGNSENTNALDQDQREARYIVGRRSTAAATRREDISDPNLVNELRGLIGSIVAAALLFI